MTAEAELAEAKARLEILEAEKAIWNGTDCDEAKAKGRDRCGVCLICSRQNLKRARYAEDELIKVANIGAKYRTELAEALIVLQALHDAPEQDAEFDDNIDSWDEDENWYASDGKYFSWAWDKLHAFLASHRVKQGENEAKANA